MAILKLYNGTAYRIEDYATPNDFTIQLDSLTADEVLETLTEENLTEIRFMTDSGAVTGVYRNKLLCCYIDHGDVLSIRINDADLCRYGLTLDEDGRIVSAVLQRYAQEGAVIVDKLPEGNPSDYIYVDGKFVYDPLTKDETEPQPMQEERITALEDQLAAYEAAYAEGVNEA